MFTQEKFLEEFTNNLKKTLLKEEKLSTLLTFLDDKNTKLYGEFDYSSALKEVDEIKSILNIITSICFKPSIKANASDIIIRSELSNKLSNDSFLETLKDASLWKQKGKKMTPEYVHNIEYNDSLITYENMFICLLLDHIYERLTYLNLNTITTHDSFEGHYELTGAIYGKTSPFNEITADFDSLFNEKALKRKETSDKVLSLISKVKRIKNSEFYKIVSKETKISLNIIPTNILLHDPLYNACYRYYLLNFLKGSQENEKINDVYYYNYALSLILTYLMRMNLINSKSLKAIFSKTSRLKIEPLTFKLRDFNITIEPDEDNLGIYIKVNFIKLKDEKALHYLYFKKNYSRLNKSEVLEIRNKKLEECDSFILVNMNNLLSEFNYVLNISYNKNDHFLGISNLFNSFTLLYKLNDDKFIKTCPVCNKNTVMVSENNYICSSCHSKYSLLHINKQSILWIKSLRRED